MGKAILIGVVLTALGALVLLAGSVSYTTEETILSVGPLEATAETRESFDIPPAIGWVLMVGGAALIMIGVFKIVRGDLI